MATTIDLGLLRFVLCGAFNVSTTYELNNIVNYGGNVYAYISPIKNAGALPTDTNYWLKILSGFNYRGAFDPAATYLAGDVVVYGGSSYYSLAGSTGKLPTDATAWGVINIGLRPMGDWAATTQYLPNDIVLRGNSSYIALSAHIASDFPTDLAAGKWKKFNGGFRWGGDWTAGTTYLTGDFIRYSGSTYLAVVDFTGGSTFSADLAAGEMQLFASGTANSNTLTTSNLIASKTVDINTHYLVNTGRISVVATLPATPADGSMIRFTDAADLTMNPLVIKTTDGSKIGGDKFPFSLDVKNSSALLIFNLTTNNWLVK